MTELTRREGESALQYHKRLVYGKLEDKTLADVDFSELSEYVYGQPYESSNARKMMYGSKRTLDIIESERREGIAAHSAADEIEEIASKTKALQLERQRFFDQRREYNKMLSAESRAEHLRDILSAAADRLGEEIGVMYPIDTSGIAAGENEAVVVFSDWHYGMTTRNVFNEYNTEICRQRVHDTVEKMIRRIRFHHCSVAHVVVLGDLVHGACHVSARVASEESVCEQLMHASEILAQSIYEISKHVEHVCVYITYGNHARTVQNKKDSIHSDNMERIVGWWLEERFKDNDGIVIMPELRNEFIMMDVCGHGFCASHGDLDTVNNSPRLLATLFHKRYGEDIEYILLGDKHHRESFNELGVTSMLCGSLCGTDDYANEKRLYSSPSQLLLIVNREDGVDAEYRIRS